MAISYSVFKVATTMVVNYRAVGPDGFGVFTYNQRRAFVPFDVAGAGVASGTVESAQLILRCTATVGGGCDVQLRSAVDPNGFGATLDATNADWASSNTYVEDTKTVNATGSWTWTVDPAHLSFTGWTFFSLFNTLEGDASPVQTGATFNTSEVATPEFRPTLRLTLFSGQVIFVNAV